MKKILPAFILALMAVAVLGTAPVSASAADVVCSSINNANVPGVPCDPDVGARGILGGIIQPVVNTLLFLVGAAAVIMLIVGGFRYVVSSGDPEAIKSAKNTIVYAIVGVVVAFVSYAAINFVVGAFG